MALWSFCSYCLFRYRKYDTGKLHCNVCSCNIWNISNYCGVVITVLALLIIIGGIKTISKVSSVVVPVMAIFYVIAGIIVILGNIHNLPAGIIMIFKMAFSVKAVGGALCGNIVASMMNAARYGVARGCFSNEAGMGSAAITAAAAANG